MSLTREKKIEILEKIIAHFEKQGQKAVAMRRSSMGVSMTTCQYRTPAGNACAIGCLIPDDRYTEVMEGQGGIKGNRLVLDALHDLGYPTDPDSVVWYHGIQRIHDGHSGPFPGMIDKYRAETGDRARYARGGSGGLNPAATW